MGPFKCPDCGIWWAGLEHRCRPSELIRQPNTTVIWGPSQTVTSTVRCTCPAERGDNYVGSCPIHDVQVTYTA